MPSDLYTHTRQKILSQFSKLGLSPTVRIRRLLRDLTMAADECIQTAWQKRIDECIPAHLTPLVALVAVGGYGRGELLPNSDIDLLVLIDGDKLDTTERDLLDAAIEKWVSALWDEGLTLGHSVHTMQECLAFCEEDLSTQTAILEGRLLAGSKAICDAFYQSFHAEFDLATFWREKIAEMRQRHAKFADTPYSLEPNCKESPGGLRDLHLMMWLARAARIGGTTHTSWQDVRDAGWLSTEQLRLLQRCENWLLSMRAHLHILSRRAENRVLFDLQGTVAQAFGFKDSPEKRASELLMQRYYLSAKTISLRCTLFLQKFEQLMSPPTSPHTPHRVKGFPDFFVVDNLLNIARDDVFIEKPHLMLDLFLAYSGRPDVTGLTSRTWDSLLKARRYINPDFRRDPANRQRFIEIFKCPDGITHTLRLMNQTGVLGRYLPVFRRIVGQMQHDLFHIYTVDQHILTVIRNLRRFTLEEHIHHHELANQFMSEFGEPWLLYLAGLFHDIAKGRGGDHSELGTADVARFAKQHGLSTEQISLLKFLVQHHLTMSTFAQKEDLSDVDVIAKFAKLVKTPQRLQALYLLTVADIRGTSPKVWNAWKDKLLSDLYRMTLRYMSGRTPIPADLIKKRQENALLQLPPGTSSGAVHKLWRQFDTEYFLRHDTATIAWHAAHITSHRDETTVAAQPYISNGEHSLHIMVYTPDAVDIFARLCSFFQQRQWSVFDAQIYTSTHNYALDTFQIVLPEFDELDHVKPEFIAELVTELKHTLSQTTPLRQPSLGRLSPRSRNFPITPLMLLQPDEDKDEYVLRLTATDRPGILYSIAYIFKTLKIRLHSARVVTLGERLEDVFIISSAQLSNPSHMAQLEEEIIKVCTVEN
jgi:[protein-PII] uridylyltransferase